MYHLEEINSFCPKSCYLRPYLTFFMNVKQQPGPDLPYGTVPGALRSDGKTLFGLQLYLAE